MPVVAVYEKQGTSAGPSDDDLRMMVGLYGGTLQAANRGTGPKGQARTVAVFDDVTTTSHCATRQGTFGDDLWMAAQFIAGTAVDYHDMDPAIPPPWQA